MLLKKKGGGMIRNVSKKKLQKIADCFHIFKLRYQCIIVYPTLQIKYIIQIYNIKIDIRC